MQNRSSPTIVGLLAALGLSLVPECLNAGSSAIPWSQIGAKAGADYGGDGLAVSPIPQSGSARLRCVFQRLEGEATREGLWLTSPVTNAVKERFRVTAGAVGRAVTFGVRRQSAAATPLCEHERMMQAAVASESGVALRFPPQSKVLAPTGTVEVADKLVRFIRPELTEEYSVSMDGVRQDFIIEQRPVGEGLLRVELEVVGARVESLADGARLVLENSGRKIAYGRLRVTDATGKELTARMEVMGERARLARTGRRPADQSERVNNSPVSSPGARGDAIGETPMAATKTVALPISIEVFDEGVEHDTQGACDPHDAMLAVVLNDTDAVYPVRIDPTFSDANWSSMGGVPGADNLVFAVAADGAGNVYIGGLFTAVGDILANHIAKWNGNSCRPWVPG